METEPAIDSPPNRFLMRQLWRIHMLAWKVSGGRWGTRGLGMDVLELVTTGHRSGEPRSVLLFYMMDDDSPIVVGSNLGADHEPAWILNLRSNPTARMKVDGVTSDVTAVFIDEPDRSEIFDRFKSAYGDYAVYDSMTERTIPIVRLLGQG